MNAALQHLTRLTLNDSQFLSVAYRHLSVSALLARLGRARTNILAVGESSLFLIIARTCSKALLWSFINEEVLQGESFRQDVVSNVAATDAEKKKRSH